MEGAYNSEMYPRKCVKKDQEDYHTQVYNEWCLGKESTGEHQKPTSKIIGSGGPIQSSAKPKQMA